MRAIKDTSGVSNVVSLIMISGIIVSLMGMIFATYLPAWGKDNEAQTLEEVMGSFMDLKSGMDTLAVGGDAGTSLTTKMPLGSEGGPMFGFGRMTGSVYLDSEGGLMEVSDGAGVVYGQSRGCIKYSSNNINIEDQVITLEGGALIRDQSGASVLKGHPNLLINSYENTGEVVFFIMMPTIEGADQSYTGTSTYLVSTPLVSEEKTDYSMGPGTSTIFRMTSKHADIWYSHIRTMAISEGLVEGAGNDFIVSTGVDVDGNDYFEMILFNIDRIEVRTAIYRVSIN